MEKISKTVYLNPIQLRSYLIKAPNELTIAGRGTGKSEGIIAPRLDYWARMMPKGLCIGVAATYMQHLTRTLPTIFKGLENWGWKRDRDYFFGRMAPASFKWDRPYFSPLKTDYFIHFKTGFGIALVSQDRPGSANGLSGCCVFGDEAKFLDKYKYDSEVLPAMRGYGHYFPDNAALDNTLLCTDMPVSSSSQWLLNLGDKLYTKEMKQRVQLVLDLEFKISEISDKIRRKEYSASSEKRMLSEVVHLQKMTDQVRVGNEDMKKLFFFQEAPSYENVDVLGVGYFEQMADLLSPKDYLSSIANKRNIQVEGGFYPLLNEDKHGYTMYDNHRLDMIGHDLSNVPDSIDSSFDADVISDQPIHIALDYGARINCLVVGQWSADQTEFRILNSMYVLHPDMLEKLIINFKEYYRHHKDKLVHYHSDHTAKMRSGTYEYTYHEEVMRVLANPKFGSWNIVDNYIGKTSSPTHRYKLWNILLSSNVVHFKLKYNKINAESWATSCMLTQVTDNKGRVEKNKSAERSPKHANDQQRAPHLSDAGDTLVVGALGSLIEPFISK